MVHTEKKSQKKQKRRTRGGYILDLIDKDFKSAILYMFKELGKPCIKN